MKQIPASIQSIADVLSATAQDIRAKKKLKTIGWDLMGGMSNAMRSSETFTADVKVLGVAATIGYLLGSTVDSLIDLTQYIPKDDDMMLPPVQEPTHVANPPSQPNP